ncbi:LD-carboxypeptidase [Paenibacillus cremeus]|uniref:LD-carboxypeptidase n=1 Tax=Paenibacillus cremeus TaxID=2163881 RepID=A0A559JRB6_9BACL|nr:LD-carboxypeptidase [Paenibacillus cremeus]TVY02416.1 LD-carboxypeptidase [Paenibacillus cremeus]
MTNMPLLARGNRVAITACSDGRRPEARVKIDELIALFREFGLEVVTATDLYRANTYMIGALQERATEINKMFHDDSINAIFDVSGGDAANQILEYIDFQAIGKTRKPFFGISDLSVMLNAMYKVSGVGSYHYQVMNLVHEHQEAQRQLLYDTLIKGTDDLFNFDYSWIRGQHMAGAVVGGNIRCFLKLVGTPYFPDCKDHVIFLESFGGRAHRTVSLLSQMEQMGCFSQCAGLILGTFTELEQHGEFQVVEDFIKELTEKRQLPIARTKELGHGNDSKAIQFGTNIVLQ